MITLTGRKISEGIAIGRLAFFKRGAREVRRIYVEDVRKELARFQKVYGNDQGDRGSERLHV